MMKHPYEATRFRLPHEGEKHIGDTIEVPVMIDLDKVECFEVCTFGDVFFTQGTEVVLPSVSINITCPYEVFKKVMEDAGMIPLPVKFLPLQP